MTADGFKNFPRLVEGERVADEAGEVFRVGHVSSCSATLTPELSRPRVVTLTDKNGDVREFEATSGRAFQVSAPRRLAAALVRRSVTWMLPDGHPRHLYGGAGCNYLGTVTLGGGWAPWDGLSFVRTNEGPWRSAPPREPRP